VIPQSRLRHIVGENAMRDRSQLSLLSLTQLPKSLSERLPMRPISQNVD